MLGISEQDIRNIIEEFADQEDFVFSEDYSDDEIDTEDEDEVNNDVDVVDDYVFEEADIDERTMNITTCNDFISLENNKSIVEHLEDQDSFLFIVMGSNDYDILCFDKDFIRHLLSNKDSNWFYECSGYLLSNNNRSMNNIINYPYVKIPLNGEGLNGFIPKKQLQALVNNNNRIYYIYPMLENGSQKMITHTVSWQNAYGPNPNYVSANHCQSGSSILVYTLKVCTNAERCISSAITA